ncbi:AAA family ATPase [Desulfolutivibrio sulfodismutans]|nr:AAA family ATPase [Desulfolutivibrio sulfodismutans]
MKNPLDCLPGIWFVFLPMIVKLTLDNFLAHGASVFEFAPGLNVLTGPNNTGKSAVVEALRCLAENPIPKHVIRHGAKEARVTVELSDGTRVAWVRKPKYAVYELTPPGASEPQTYAKFNRTPPEDVLAALRLNLVPVEGSDDIDVHLGNQREPVFLLGKPGSVMASFFAASSESAHLIAMQNLLTDKVRKAKNEKRRLEAAADAARRDLDRLSRLPDLECALEVGRDTEDRLAVLARDIPALQTVLSRRESLKRRLAALAARTAALQTLAPAPQPFAVAPLARVVERQTAFLRSREQAASRITALAALAAPPTLAATAAMDRLAADMAHVRAAHRRMSRKSAALAVLAPAPEVFPVAALADHLAARRALAAKMTRLEKSLARREHLSPPPEAQSAAPLAALVRDMRALRQRRDAAADVLAGRDARLASLHTDIEARLGQVGVCPLCGGDLRPETFLDAPRRAT